ncbi:MAG: glycoside hydrolase family 88 protein [Clostridia bacterium]|nr:glycoside hydrolase family 88 protein [Clostridia bacterium]
MGRINVSMDEIIGKIKNNALSFKGKLPACNMASDGKFSLNNGGGWTDGFYIGVINLAYILSGDKQFLDLAAEYDEFFKKRIRNTDEVNEANGFLKLDHDVGFIFLPVNGFRYNLLKKEEDKEILIKAADVLVERFNEAGGFIRAWDTWKWDTDEKFIEEKKGKVIIDSMMNIPLLFQVAEITQDKKYYDIALRHAHTVASTIVRDDYSTFHSYNFDHKTGAPICGKTVQGYSDDSCWSRGQAWAVYGFALAYKYTKEEKFIEISKKTAEYFMDNLTAVDMPSWDFAAKDQTFAPWDSAASTICASGLLEIYELTGDKKYYDYAMRLLDAIERFCLTVDYDNCQPLILHGCIGTAYSKGNEQFIKNLWIGQALTYSDYFYLECKLKLSDNKIRIF